MAYLFLVRRMKALAAVLFGLVVTSVHAQKITGAEIIEYGVLKKIKSEGLLDAPNTVAGKSNNDRSAARREHLQSKRIDRNYIRHLGKTPRRTQGSHDHGSFSLHSPQAHGPGIGHTREADEWESPRPIGTPRYVSYTFDHDWEIKPGNWTIQVLSDGKVIAEKTFDVIAP